MWRGGETFEDIGGVQNAKDFLLAVLAGIEPPRVVVFIDEIEKAFAGTGTDLSGVKTEMTGTILTYMQDREVDGSVFIGPPGSCKSATAKEMCIRDSHGGTPHFADILRRARRRTTSHGSQARFLSIRPSIYANEVKSNRCLLYTSRCV